MLWYTYIYIFAINVQGDSIYTGKGFSKYLFVLQIYHLNLHN